MVGQTKRVTWVFLLVVSIAGCGPKHFGYQLHPSSDKQAKDYALVVHAVNDFAVEIYSINGKDTQGVIKTNSQIPTYLELKPGKYEFGVGLRKGYGPCGRVDIIYKKPAYMSVEVEAGKVYLLQRKSKFNSAILCDRLKNNIQVEFYLSELPALPYEDVRDSFSVIDINALGVFEK